MDRENESGSIFEKVSMAVLVTMSGNELPQEPFAF
jgi:hypothetical protein